MHGGHTYTRLARPGRFTEKESLGAGSMVLALYELLRKIGGESKPRTCPYNAQIPKLYSKRASMLVWTSTLPKYYEALYSKPPLTEVEGSGLLDFGDVAAT